MCIRDSVEIVKLCAEWGATEFDSAMDEAAYFGHIEIVKLCKEWGAADFNSAMDGAAYSGHIEIVKLCREWLGFGDLHRDLLQCHHKRQFAQKIHDELLPVAWHPDRVWEWCFDEEEKQVVGQLWN